MLKKRMIEKDEAEAIEFENNKSNGFICCDRPATMAESIYLDGLKKNTPFSFYMSYLPGLPVLVVVELTSHENEDLWIEKCGNLIKFAKINSARPTQLYSVDIKGFNSDGLSRYSWSAPSKAISALCFNAPRSRLLGPKFLPVPPTEYEMKSPGHCIYDLGVQEIFHADSITIQGGSDLIEIGVNEHDDFFYNQMKLLKMR